jgi:hypothetical protein
MSVACPLRQASAGAHGDRDQRTVANALVGAAPEARLPVAGGVPPGLLKRRPAGEGEGRVGLYGVKYATENKRAGLARGGCVAPVIWGTTRMHAQRLPTFPGSHHFLVQRLDPVTFNEKCPATRRKERRVDEN